jgi:hypothetical protein
MEMKVTVILSEAKDLQLQSASQCRFFASLRMTAVVRYAGNGPRTTDNGPRTTKPSRLLEIAEEELDLRRFSFRHRSNLLS